MQTFQKTRPATESYAIESDTYKVPYQSVRPDSAKFHIFGNTLKALAIFLWVYLVSW